jgi:hypothetical protein
MKEREWCLYGIRLRQKGERSGAFMASGSVRKEKKEKKSGAFMASYSYLLPTSVASKKSKIPFVSRSS